MKTAALALALVAGLAAIALVSSGRLALGEQKDVAQTKHDVSSAGVPACIYCHIPRDAAGQLLWPGGLTNQDGPLSGEKRICFSCHDGTVTRERSYVFDSNRPEHLRKPGVEGEDCDRCHNPHEQTSKFLKMPKEANFCWNCHFRAGPSDHPIGVDAPAAGIHPDDTTFDPKAGDFVGTRLWNAEGTGPGNLVACLTCHSPHGGQHDTLIMTVPYTAEVGYSESLCGSCHNRARER